MTQEEKAKAYDEALERARKIHSEIINNEIIGFPGQIEDIFPELRDSEDEKVRKALIDGVRQIRCKNGITQEQMISYLEKQKEQSITTNDLDEEIHRFFDDCIDVHEAKLYGSISEKVIPVDCYEITARHFAKWGEKHKEEEGYETIPVESTLEYKLGFKAGKESEKQEVRKPDPKFRVGDVMRTKQEAAEGITDGLPVVVSIDEDDYICNNETISITDQEEYEFPPMNTEQKPTDLPPGFYFIDLDGKKYYSKEFRYGDMKMKIVEDKSGKPAEWSEEDDEMVEEIKHIVFGAGSVRNGMRGKIHDWLYNRLKYLCPAKQDWSDEDIRRIRSEEYTKGFNDAAFGSNLKEWSVKDEDRIRQIERIAQQAGCTQKLQEEIHDWLKSLRPSWKPSKNEERLINTSISFLKDFADKGYENAVECIDWLKSKLNGNSCK